MRAVLFASLDSAAWFCGSTETDRWIAAQVTGRDTEAPAARPANVDVPTP